MSHLALSDVPHASICPYCGAPMEKTGITIVPKDCDVVVDVNPGQVYELGEIVRWGRYGATVVWVDVESSKVRLQLHRDPDCGCGACEAIRLEQRR